MDQIDYSKELSRIFAEYAAFFDLPIRTSAEHGDVYTRLPRSLFASLMLKEAYLLEHLRKGHFSLKELGEDCAALYALADRDFKGIEHPEICLETAKIPKSRWYLYREGMNRILEDVPARAYGIELDPNAPFRERRKRKPPTKWVAGIVLAFALGYWLSHLPGKPGTPPPVAAPEPTATLFIPEPTGTPTPTETATATSTSTPRPQATPKPKPKPKAKPKPKPAMRPTAVPTPTTMAIPQGADLLF